MNDLMYIPKILNVGYQERNDTYSGKLAYVVYTDGKGKLRKEGSWRSWCKHFLPDSDNVPTSGFVLNRDVGGVRRSYGWDARLEKVRVYDPRGWEVEITIPNLLFILQECTSTKGKGLEGEFVYAWQGKDMVLLPTSSEQYKSCLEYTANQAKKVTKEDITVGNWVTFKDNETYIYLGRHDCRQGTFDQAKKQHVYYDPSKNKFRYESGFTKVAIVGEKDDNFATYLSEFLLSWKCNKIVDLEWEETSPPDIQTWCGYGYVMIDNKVHRAYLYNRNDTYYGGDYMWRAGSSGYTNITTLSEFITNQNRGRGIELYKNSPRMKWVKPIYILANGRKSEDGK